MSRPTPKAPIGGGAGLPAVTISDAQWDSIGEKVGFPLIEGIRREILEATINYASLATIAKGAVPLATEKERIRQVKAAAEALYVALGKGSPGGYAAHLINQSFPIARRRPDKLRVMAADAHATMQACTIALTRLEADRAEGFRKYDAWEMWIVELRTRLDKWNFPTGV